MHLHDININLLLILQVPLIIPVIVLIASTYLVLAPIIDKPRMEFLYAFLFTVGGLILYFPFVHFKWRLPGMGNTVRHCLYTC